MASPEASQLRCSMPSLIAAIITFVFGVVLMRNTPALSLFNLFGLFIVGASLGIPFGYAKAKWSGALGFAFVAGMVLLFGVFLLLSSGLLPEAD